MDIKIAKMIGWVFALVILTLVVICATNVFLLAFASILLAILLNSIGRWTHKLIRFPYPLALLTAIVVIFGIFTLIFWLYSSLIADQFERLMVQLPEAANKLRKSIVPSLGNTFLSKVQLQKEFFLVNQKILEKVVMIFSFTIGSITGFVIFLIVGLYLALSPERYVRGFLFLIPKKRKKRVVEVIEKIGISLRLWLLSKILAMLVVGILTFLGLWIMGIPLAFILGLIMALLTFIPYVGPILAAIPGILIAFAQSPLMALYVTLLYIAIHVAEGYLVTPYIEQRAVSIPPALTIMAQILMVVLVGGLGLALATPLAVVCIALAQQSISQPKLKSAS